MCGTVVVPAEERITGCVQSGGCQRRLSIPQDQQMKVPNPMSGAEQMLNKSEFLWLLHPSSPSLSLEKDVSRKASRKNKKGKKGFPAESTKV